MIFLHAGQDGSSFSPSLCIDSIKEHLRDISQTSIASDKELILASVDLCDGSDGCNFTVCRNIKQNCFAFNQALLPTDIENLRKFVTLLTAWGSKSLQ